MSNLWIRPYRPADEAAVIQIWVDCGLVVPQNNPQRDIERKRSLNPDWFLIGELDQRAVATCMVGYDGHRGWINYLAVSPLHQRLGFARQLMDTAEELLYTAGCPKINLQVRATNAAVIAFYQRLGFTDDRVVSLGKRLVVDAPDRSHSLE